MAASSIATAASSVMSNAHYFEAASNPKMDEIKKLLDGKDNKEKLEGMKRLIAMVSKGRDVSALFPDVVKNVVCQNLEVKKLVYVYLTHYAEIEPEPALLAINTFQKDLKDQNPLIRAQALRVLSSIRLKVIVQIIILAIKKCITDTSPYVRKTAAHAMAKVYNLDPEQKEALIEVLATLLKDNHNMVLGSAVAVFNEMCPERFDLIHPHFQKLCRKLADIDEWGQIALLQMLTRYARNQFLHPDGSDANGAAQADKPFYSDDEDDDEKEGVEAKKEHREMDPDHRLLISAASPLLQSRNNGVVVAVAMLYFYCAPYAEASRIGKPLVRILKSSRETQYVVLANIATMAAARPELFQPYIAEFFVSASEPSFIRSLKLEILTCVASSSNITKVLKEFNTYVRREDKAFVTDTIQAIGRCAARINEVSESCLHGLMGLITNPSPVVVAESIIAMKHLLLAPAQQDEPTNQQIVTRLATMLDSITSGPARASIVWVVGEYCRKLPLICPDTLRKCAKSFADEEDGTKLQILNLGAKLLLANAAETRPFFQHILNLAKYDKNYDIRDRARLMRLLLLNPAPGQWAAKAETLFFAPKPPPVITSPSEDRKRFVLGSLSHLLNQTAPGYAALPDFPAVAPDPSVRRPVIVDQQAQNGFYDEEEEGEEGEEEAEAEEGEEEAEDFYGDEEEEEVDAEAEEEEEEAEEEEEEEEEEEVEAPAPVAPSKTKPAPPSPSTAAAADPFAAFFSGPTASTPASPPPASSPAKSPAPSSSSFDDLFAPAPIAPAAAAPPANLKRYALLDDAAGLQLQCAYTRGASPNGADWRVLQLYFKNLSGTPLTGIKLVKAPSIDGSDVQPFQDIAVLPPGADYHCALHVKFVTVQLPVRFDISHSGASHPVALQAAVGELLRPNTLASSDFDSLYTVLCTVGAHPADVSTGLGTDGAAISARLNEVAVLSIVPSDQPNVLKFAAKTLPGAPLLLSITLEPEVAHLKLCCADAAVATALLADLQKALAPAPAPAPVTPEVASTPEQAP